MSTMQGRCSSRLKWRTCSGAVVIVVVALVLGETFVNSQYYSQPLDALDPASRSQYYFYDDHHFLPRDFGAERTALPAAQVDLMAEAPIRRNRRAASYSDEEDDEEDYVRESPSRTTLPVGRPKPVKLPKGFNDRVNKRIKMSRRSKARLHGDPDPIDDDDEEGRRPEARLLWPFSIEITKGQKEKGWGGPGGHGSYHEWLAHNGWGTHGQSGGWGGWGPIQGPWGSWGEHGAGQHGKHPYGWKPGDLTDEEILNSKHYKKYRKKKKKKIKKLKKKLKFKRLVQKILQKHITYLDKIAPY